MKLVCSEAVPREGIELNDFSLEHNGDKQDKTMTSTCIHVHGSSNGNVKTNSYI
ncbi:Glycosyl hydrolases family 28 [Musa troglodytarum]|uniref:Glycosyl hydrolases family 28 n=1 Tax=Musa troglodytarum TaxID=320322 RepID=A0A9E7JAP8_9LILI|nr:Glycosyl hydrolases family 28 [Musa troglodytarum]